MEASLQLHASHQSASSLLRESPQESCTSFPDNWLGSFRAFGAWSFMASFFFMREIFTWVISDRESEKYLREITSNIRVVNYKSYRKNMTDRGVILISQITPMNPLLQVFLC